MATESFDRGVELTDDNIDNFEQAMSNPVEIDLGTKIRGATDEDIMELSRKYKLTEKKMNELKPGDKIIGSDGKLTEITNVYEEHIPEEMYEIDFGEFTIEASGNHLWYCETNEDRKNESYYRKLMENYMMSEVLEFPEEENTAYPKEMLASKLSTNGYSYEFILKVCETIGHSYNMNNAIYDGMELIEDNLLPCYSYEDIYKYVKSLKEMKQGDYFKFGKVRETKEIFELIKNGDEVNIPTIKEMQNNQ